MKFTYFELYGRGEAIRMVLNHKGVAFEDNRVPMDKWAEVKPTIPGGVLPVLEIDDGTVLGQSLAIIRYLGRVYGYYSDDVMEAYHIDAILETASDVLAVIYKPHFAKEEDKQALIDGLFNSTLPSFLSFLEPKLANGGWLVGNKLTVADFFAVQIYTSYFANPNVTFAQDKFASLLEQYPNYKAFGERFVAENKAHIDARPPLPI